MMPSQAGLTDIPPSDIFTPALCSPCLSLYDRPREPVSPCNGRFLYSSASSSSSRSCRTSWDTVPGRPANCYERKGTWGGRVLTTMRRPRSLVQRRRETAFRLLLEGCRKTEFFDCAERIQRASIEPRGLAMTSLPLIPLGLALNSRPGSSCKKGCAAGEYSYRLFDPVRLNFDLMTGFFVAAPGLRGPLQHGHLRP